MEAASWQVLLETQFRASEVLRISVPVVCLRFNVLLVVLHYISRCINVWLHCEFGVVIGSASGQTVRFLRAVSAVMPNRTLVRPQWIALNSHEVRCSIFWSAIECNSTKSQAAFLHTTQENKNNGQINCCSQCSPRALWCDQLLGLQLNFSSLLLKY